MKGSTVGIIIIFALLVGGGYLLYDYAQKNAVENEVKPLVNETIDKAYPDASNVSYSFDVSNGYTSCTVKGSLYAKVVTGVTAKYPYYTFESKTVYFTLVYEKINGTWKLMDSKTTT